MKGEYKRNLRRKKQRKEQPKQEEGPISLAETQNKLLTA